MRISTLAVCTLATIAAQDFARPASARSLSTPKSAPEVTPPVASKSLSVATLTTHSVAEPIAAAQIEFSHPAPPSEVPQFHPSATVAQSTIIEELDGQPPASDPQPLQTPTPVTPDSPASPPNSGQYLQEDPLPDSSPTPIPAPTPASPASPTASPAPAPSTSTPASPPLPVPSASPASSHLTTEPIAPTVQIGNVILPHRGTLPANFVFPIRIRVTVDRTMTTNTPITNSTQNLAAWEERIRACLDEKPQLFAVGAGGTLLPILFDGQPGRILRNANGRMVCSTTQ
jgi:hypothetical protein